MKKIGTFFGMWILLVCIIVFYGGCQSLVGERLYPSGAVFPAIYNAYEKQVLVTLHYTDGETVGPFLLDVNHSYVPLEYNKKYEALDVVVPDENVQLHYSKDDLNAERIKLMKAL